MRVYFGIKPPARIRNQLARKIHPLIHASGLPLRVQKANHLHITTHFVGEISPKGLPELIRAFRKSNFPHSSEIQLGGKPQVGTFGKELVYLRVTDNESLLHSLKKEGQRIAPVHETYAKYTPHLSLARNPKQVELTPLVDAINDENFAFSFTPSEVLLIHSHEVKGIKHHDIIAKRRLSRGKKPS